MRLYLLPTYGVAASGVGVDAEGLTVMPFKGNEIVSLFLRVPSYPYTGSPNPTLSTKALHITRDSARVSAP